MKVEGKALFNEFRDFVSYFHSSLAVEKIFWQMAELTDSLAYINRRDRCVDEGGPREDRMHCVIHVECPGEPPRAADRIRRGYGRT
jgi:hypothetical protein